MMGDRGFEFADEGSEFKFRKYRSGRGVSISKLHSQGQLKRQLPKVAKTVVFRL